MFAFVQNTETKISNRLYRHTEKPPMREVFVMLYIRTNRRFCRFHPRPHVLPRGLWEDRAWS